MNNANQISHLINQLLSPIRQTVSLLQNSLENKYPSKSITLNRVNLLQYELVELKSSRQIIEHIVEYVYKVSRKSLTYSSQELENGLKWHLYSYTPKNHDSSWLDFLSPQLSDGHTIQYGITSLILFAEYNRQIFYIQGGKPNRRISRYEQALFGIYVLCSLIEVDDVTIQRVQHRPIEGIVLVADKAFSEQQAVDTIKRIGHIPIKITAKAGRICIDSIFNFESYKNVNTITIHAADGFKISSDLNFNELSEFVVICSELYAGANFSNISDLLPLNEGEIINSLNGAVVRKIFESQTKLSRFDTTVLHPSRPLRYVASDQYKVTYDRDVDHEIVSKRSKVLKTTISIINRNITNANSEVEFFAAFGKIQVIARYDKGKYEKAPLSSMLQTTQYWYSKDKLIRQTYLKVAGKWFYHGVNFIKQMNQTLIRLLEQSPSGIEEFFLDWKDDDIEFIYNLNQQKISVDSICMDKITPNGIELCDILKFGQKFTYFIHVKSGFNTSLRDLSYQAINAHSMIQSELLKDHSEYLFEAYAKAPYMFNEIPFHDFLLKIKSNPLKFIIAIGVKNEYEPTEIIRRSRSTVAKLSLIDGITTFLDSKSAIGVQWIRIKKSE